MNALEDEPESKGRWGRMGIGLAIAGGLGLALVIGADHIVPSKRLLSEVLPIDLVEAPVIPPKKDEPPPPPPPQQEAPKPKPKSDPKPAPASAPPPQQQNPQPDNPNAEQVGLDSSSFGSGSGGPAFHVGTSQMGTPGGGIRSVAPEAPKPPPRLVEARVRAGDMDKLDLARLYTDKARRMNVQGLMVIEVDVDERGRITRCNVRGKLEPGLDENACKAVGKWTLEPASLGGRAIASTKFLRLRFELE